MLKYLFLILPVFFGSQGLAQKKPAIVSGPAMNRDMPDSALLDMVQRQTIRYFWDFAHPVSGMARERSNTTAEYGNEVVTTGGTGFGVMALIVGVQRKWLSRDSVARHILQMLRFLEKADSYHGVFPHWMNGSTGKTIRFSRKDDGADLVETSFLFEGLLCAREYFDAKNRVEAQIRSLVTSLWNDIEWNWFTRGGEDVLYWHWSPNNGWSMNFPIHGYNEALIVYILAASGTRYPVSDAVYHKGWAMSNFFYNGKTFYGYKLPLGFDYGGPLFFTHYSFLGLDPHGLKDQYADYWEQNLNHTLINRAYCMDNPRHFKGYGGNSWGLTSSDDPRGYSSHSPTHDDGVITPSAALSSFPYTPLFSMQALKYFYYDQGSKLWGPYGFKDAFSESKGWYADSYLAIDEGPIPVMIENYRSGLFWKLFMHIPEVQEGLRRLGFTSPYFPEKEK